MRFAKTTSYNRHDTKVIRRGGRTVVELGGQERAQIILLATLTYRRGVTVSELLRKINDSIKEEYSARDISSIVRRLIEEGYMSKREGKIYTTSKLVKQFEKL